MGASQQASATDDAKEASAGWYWQFNRKQGYTVTDEGSRKPESTWITDIDEDTNWLMENDPCTLELGAGWRIPTSTEWKSVMEQWKDPWDSELKIHNSGCLFDKDGLLNSRGAKLFFWSSSQFNSQLGYYLYTDYNSFTFKSFGYPLRCLWDTPSKASLLTSGVVSITTNSASCGASHLVENGTPILAKGICWSTSPSPTIVLKTKTMNGSGSDDFISSLTGLEPYTTYYVRAYATNGSGTAYGNEVSFKTMP